MTTLEDELRRTFERHESLVPCPEPVAAAIAERVRRHRVRRRSLTAVGAAVVVIALLAAVPLVMRPTADATLLPGRPAAVPDVRTVLVVGHDRPVNGVARADAIVLANIDRAARVVYLVSIPRDLAVGGVRLTTVYADGGYEALARSVSGLTGVRVDAGVTVSMEALREVTDAVGGVDMCVTDPVTSIHTGQAYAAGCRRFDGRSAVDYLRQRRDLADGARGRDRHVRQYLKALTVKLSDRSVLTDPVAVSRLLQAAGDGLRVRSGASSLTELIGQLAIVRPDGLVSVEIPVTDRLDPSGPVLVPADPAVFAAIRDGRLADWASAHPAE